MGRRGRGPTRRNLCSGTGGGTISRIHAKIYVALSPADLEGYVYGKDVLIATHGFNNDRAQGIQALSMWATLLGLPNSAAFVGVLWPGDSESLHALCYPAEPIHAMDAGGRLADLRTAIFRNAASISFASHSLGARVILEAMTARCTLPVRRAIVMAGAIDDRCLTSEYKNVPAEIRRSFRCSRRRKTKFSVGHSRSAILPPRFSVTIIPGGSRR